MINNQGNKISIVTSSLNGGGAEKIAVNLANYYASIGHEVDLVVFKLVGPYQELVGGGVNVIDFGVSRTRYVLPKLRRYLKENNESIILSVIRDANIFVGLAATGLILSKLTYREANTLDAVLRYGWFKCFLYKILMKISYSRAINVIANSDDTKSDLVKYKITRSDKITVIPNPALLPGYEFLKLESVDEEWFSKKDIKVVLAVGRLHPQKNFSFLIKIFKEVHLRNSSARLMIVGEGQDKEALVSQICAEGLSGVVKIVPFKGNIYPYYHNADVFALTSNWEGFGNVLVEALSVGLPVVSTNCRGGPKMILKNGEYGRLITLGDHAGYVQAILSELEHPSKKESFMDYARLFRVESIAKEYLAVMEKKRFMF